MSDNTFPAQVAEKIFKLPFSPTVRLQFTDWIPPICQSVLSAQEQVDCAALSSLQSPNDVVKNAIFSLTDWRFCFLFVSQIFAARPLLNGNATKKARGLIHFFKFCRCNQIPVHCIVLA